MRHDSRYGTTCWFCGGVGRKGKTLDKVIYQSCEDCHRVKGTREEIREKRNADVKGLSIVMAGGLYEPVYWTPFRFQRMLEDNWGVPAVILQRFRWQEYEDSTWEGTKARRQKGAKAYAKQYYADLRKRQREGVERTIQEMIGAKK